VFTGRAYSRDRKQPFTKSLAMMARSAAIALCGLGLSLSLSAATAADCPGNLNALGTSRVISVDPVEHARLGTMQYAETLPLADKELVLTFDDGPLPPYSNRILDSLASECVKATYFVVGRMARAYPAVLRRIRAEGHTIGTHSQNHPMIFNQMPITRVQAEIEDGIASAATALGDRNAVAPFFRIPGLNRGSAIEIYLQERGLMLWSADFPADDWKRIQANEVLSIALRRLEKKRKGILLLHDIQPATALALPALLRELKARGYRIVHVVPASVEQPKTATTPQEWLLARSRKAWPRVVNAVAKTSAQRQQGASAWPAPLELRPALRPDSLNLRPAFAPLILSN
jgi:peptidoglycan/xylan/chitin deacetylase (PgdA/CDA1 family)